MTENVLTMTPGRSLRDAARFMAERNVGAVVILGDAGIRSLPVGVGLWPTVVLHAAMTGWCALNLFSTPK